MGGEASGSVGGSDHLLDDTLHVLPTGPFGPSVGFGEDCKIRNAIPQASLKNDSQS